VEAAIKEKRVEVEVEVEVESWCVEEPSMACITI
jgi:hypothetical protein